jgi:hypothetical protein
MQCSTASDCALVDDCRCNNGETAQGRTCDNQSCLTRNQFCDAACANRNGWIPNPKGCWWWSLQESQGTAADYAGAQQGCASGAKIRVERPGSPELAWCIPMAQCQTDNDCPNPGPTGVRWRCHEPVMGAVADSMRLCMDLEETLCNLR